MVKTLSQIKKRWKRLSPKDWTEVKIYVVNGSNLDSDWINGDGLFTSKVDNFMEAEVILFTGGADINPALYGDNLHPLTRFNENRDSKEVKIFDFAKANNIPMIGICRGAQLLCALNGGRLIQHVNHPQTHLVVDYNDNKYFVNSYHHQMASPEGSNHKLIAWSKGISKVHEMVNDEGVVDVKIEKEAEIVWYPEAKSLGIQHHPEWMNPNSKATKAIRGYIKKYIYGN